MKSKRTVLVAALLLCASLIFADGAFVKSDLYPTEQSFSCASQLGLGSVSTDLPVNAALRAVGTPDYPVRPGDIYQLSYYDGSKPVVETIQIDSNYNASISNIGNVSAKGLTYLAFKTDVENKVKTFYSYAKPILTLQSCGVFSVNVAGEVYNSREVTVWGLTRLSDLTQYATEYASTRDVRITYENGKTYTFDLFAALRLGQDVQNPYLEPGCTVTFQKAKITVSLSGAVRRPGVYQPQESDTLAYLIQAYSSGLTNKADSSSYMVARYVNGELIMNNIPAEEAASYKLQFGDAIFVPEKINDLPSVEVQGAVAGGKIYYQFFIGETVEQMEKKLSSSLASDADVKNIVVTRGTKVLSKDATLAEGDVVTVPYLTQYVTVAGAVRTPGKFQYVPGKDMNYYISLAGGFADNAKKTSAKIYSEGGVTITEVLPNSLINVSYRETSNTATTISIVSTVLAIILSGLQIATYAIK